MIRVKLKPVSLRYRSSELSKFSTVAVDNFVNIIARAAIDLDIFKLIKI